MKTKADKIRQYDDSLLRQESFLKIGRVALIVICGVFLASVITLAPSGFFENNMSRATVPLFFILLGVILVERSLRHIASIKLYRSEKKESQPKHAR